MLPNGDGDRGARSARNTTKPNYLSWLFGMRAGSDFIRRNHPSQTLPDSSGMGEDALANGNQRLHLFSGKPSSSN